MNKTIKLTEAELNKLISESVKRVLNEECDEGAFNKLRNKIGAVKDTFTKGGNYNDYFNDRQMKTVGADIENLKNQYDENPYLYVYQQSQDAVAQINAKYDHKIEQLEMQRNAEIKKVTGKAQEKWDKYYFKLRDLRKEFNKAYVDRYSPHVE